MKIALDYDQTYTADPTFWNNVIDMAKQKGHEIRIVTHRHHKHDKIEGLDGLEKIYTDGVAKKWFCEHRGDLWTPDIWIDDKPKGIFENGPLTQEQVEEWRANR